MMEPSERPKLIFRFAKALCKMDAACRMLVIETMHRVVINKNFSKIGLGNTSSSTVVAKSVFG